ncbi:unnamed protein product, partial [Symbiodinium sp. CCMP2592]
EAAITMVLTPTVEGEDVVWKLGVRVYPDLSVTKSYRQMMLLIHPDKNDGSTRSSEASKVLLSVWEKFVSWNPALRKSSAKLCRLRALNSFEKDLRDVLQKDSGSGPSRGSPSSAEDSAAAPPGRDVPPTEAPGSSSSSAPPAHHEAGAPLLRDWLTGCTSQDSGFMDHEDPDMHGESSLGWAPADLHFEGCRLRWEAVSEELYWLRQRAVRIRGKVGYVPVLEREGQGLPGIGKLPPLPEQDGKRKRNQDELEAAVAKRDEAISKLPKVLLMAGESGHGGRGLPVPFELRRGFGGSFANWSSRTLSAVFDDNETDIPEVARIQGLEGKVRRAHRLIWRNLPEVSRAWLEGGSGGPVAFFAYADWERKVLQSMAAAAGASLLALEHDGVCALSEAKDRVLQAAADLGVQVAAKPVPNAVEFAAAEHPDFDWKLSSSSAGARLQEGLDVLGGCHFFGRGSFKGSGGVAALASRPAAGAFLALEQLGIINSKPDEGQLAAGVFSKTVWMSELKQVPPLRL